MLYRFKIKISSTTYTVAESTLQYLPGTGTLLTGRYTDCNGTGPVWINDYRIVLYGTSTFTYSVLTKDQLEATVLYRHSISGDLSDVSHLRS